MMYQTPQTHFRCHNNIDNMFNFNGDFFSFLLHTKLYYDAEYGFKWYHQQIKFYQKAIVNYL